MHAAAHGILSGGFPSGGLIVGYLLAAWQYQRLGIVLGAYLKSPWVADSRRLSDYFLCRDDRVWYRRPNRSMGDESFGAAAGGPLSGWRLRRIARGFDCGVRTGWNDFLYPVGKVAGGVAAGAVLSGCGARCHLGCAGRVAGAFLPGTGFASSSTTIITGRSGKTDLRE